MFDLYFIFTLVLLPLPGRQNVQNIFDYTDYFDIQFDSVAANWRVMILS